MTKKKIVKKVALPTLKETEITASYSGKISTGNYENESPFFALKEIWNGEVTPEFINERQAILHNLNYAKFTDCERRSLLELIKKKRKDIRFYGDYPSVTSIINWDADFYVSPDELCQYGARGTIIHEQCRIYLETGKWLDPKDIPEIYTQMVILTKGSLKLSLDGYNFRAFKSKYPFTSIQTEVAVYNHEHKYAGRQDIKYRRGEVIGIADIKTGTIDKVKCMKQLSAYASCVGNENVQELMIIPLNSSTKQGFSQAIIEEDPKKYLPMFLDNRAEFKERFCC